MPPVARRRFSQDRGFSQRQIRHVEGVVFFEKTAKMTEIPVQTVATVSPAISKDCALRPAAEITARNVDFGRFSAQSPISGRGCITDRECCDAASAAQKRVAPLL
jgi:hypothetical protein